MLLHNFKDDSVRSLAKAGQQHFCRYITVIEAFPFVNEKETICRSALDQAAVSSVELKDMLDSIVGDTKMRRNLIDYICFIFSLPH